MPEQYYLCDTCGSGEYSVKYSTTVKSTLANSDFTVFGELGEYHQVVTCDNCGLCFSNPRDDSSSLEQKYMDMSVEEYLTAEESRRLIASKDASFLEKYCSSGRVLDIGCSAGLFLAALGKNFTKTGIEPSVAASDAAAQNLPGGEIHCATLFEAPLQDRQFDAITMWDVIEHLESPKKALVKVASHLVEGGHLVLVTPNIGSITARLMGKRWTHLIRGHIFYYTKKSIRRILEETGYEVISISSYTRYFKLGYVLRRVGILSPGPSWTDKFGASNVTIPINMGDSLLIVARKKPTPDV